MTSILVIGITAIAIAAGARHMVGELRSEFIATLVAESTAKGLAGDSGSVTISRDEGHALEGVAPRYEGQIATRIQVVFRDGRPIKQFLVFSGGKVVFSNYTRDEYGLEHQIGQAVIANWGN